MTTCAGCGSEIRRGRCSTCNYLSMSYILEQETLEDECEPEPLTDEQQAVETTLRSWFDQWEQERCDAESITERREAEELRLFATGR